LVGTTVRVERYGPSTDGELLFAIYNHSAAEVGAELCVDGARLRLKTGRPSATALVRGRPLTCRAVGAKIEVSVPLASGECEVVRLIP
jgi:hypothetical protein